MSVRRKNSGGGIALYWDTSALLSVVWRDAHSAAAMRHAAANGVHLVSSLAWVELHAVLARIQREGAASAVLVDAAREAVASGPWRHLSAIPRRDVALELAEKWPLRGADLWHLALVKTLQTDLGPLKLITFDARLSAAAEGEALAAR